VSTTVENQLEVGGNCGRVFTHSPQVWDHGDIGDEEAQGFREGTEVDLRGAVGHPRVVSREPLHAQG